MNGNKNYYLVTCVKQQANDNTIYFRCIYSNGVQELYRVYSHGKDIPTIIYDRE